MAATGFAVEADHPCLPGHFPGRPVVPGVVVLDRVVAAIEAQHGPLGALRLPQVKFVQPLLPGQAAAIAFEPLPGQAPRWRFRVERDGTLLASGEIAAGQPARA
ncbi:dehydratase [Luteimonas sp. FCS-9]|uniref:dehydratase n=1 Tax=Luteimonas sp. FCS-9 TaxID=1547516 RepID=UPI00063E7225|nr:dehydratase [Luteimonas sp. FCS-9]KLI98090.1 dehydratase [Luteimonas sp. FCS-9]